MDNIIVIVTGILQITLLNLVLSADNIGVIALATKKLPKDFAKKVTLAGISGAVLLRIVFTCIISYIMLIQWLPIKLIGGVLLIKITWDLIKAQDEEEEDTVQASNHFWKAVFSIIVADISMSLDNVLAIAAAADGSMILIIFGILLNIPILFFGSKLVVNLMNKYKIVIYIGGAILAHTSLKMILEDRLFIAIVSHSITLVLSWGAAVLTLVYGIYLVRKANKQKPVDVFEA